MKKFMFLFCVILSVLSYSFYSQVNIAKNQSFRKNIQLYEIKPGMGFNQLCNKWLEKQYLESCWVYQLYAKLQPERFTLKAGVYSLTNLSVLDAIEKINRGEQHSFSFTIIEGSTLKDVLETVQSLPYIDDDLNAGNLLDARGTNKSLEGWLLPETYFYQANSKASVILSRAKDALYKVLDLAWQERQTDIPLVSKYEVLILASIIEKESGHAPERAKIASVFMNRLNKKMRLQTDPTIIYGLGDTFDGDIKRADMHRYTPYNTYKIKRLPPTPIAMPSKEAIYAVTQPLQTDFYYFVSKGNGEHHFSKNLNSHNKAVQKYILKRKHDS